MGFRGGLIFVKSLVLITLRHSWISVCINIQCKCVVHRSEYHLCHCDELPWLISLYLWVNPMLEPSQAAFRSTKWLSTFVVKCPFVEISLTPTGCTDCSCIHSHSSKHTDVEWIWIETRSLTWYASHASYLSLYPSSFTFPWPSVLKQTCGSTGKHSSVY